MKINKQYVIYIPFYYTSIDLDIYKITSAMCP